MQQTLWTKEIDTQLTQLYLHHYKQGEVDKNISKVIQKIHSTIFTNSSSEGDNVGDLILDEDLLSRLAILPDCPQPEEEKKKIIWERTFRSSETKMITLGDYLIQFWESEMNCSVSSHLGIKLIPDWSKFYKSVFLLNNIVNFSESNENNDVIPWAHTCQEYIDKFRCDLVKEMLVSSCPLLLSDNYSSNTLSLPNTPPKKRKPGLPKSYSSPNQDHPFKEDQTGESSREEIIVEPYIKDRSRNSLCQSGKDTQRPKNLSPTLGRHSLCQSGKDTHKPKSLSPTPGRHSLCQSGKDIQIPNNLSPSLGRNALCQSGKDSQKPKKLNLSPVRHRRCQSGTRGKEDNRGKGNSYNPKVSAQIQFTHSMSNGTRGKEDHKVSKDSQIHKSLSSSPVQQKRRGSLHHGGSGDLQIHKSLSSSPVQQKRKDSLHHGGSGDLQIHNSLSSSPVQQKRRDSLHHGGSGDLQIHNSRSSSPIQHIRKGNLPHWGSVDSQIHNNLSSSPVQYIRKGNLQKTKSHSPKTNKVGIDRMMKLAVSHDIECSLDYDDALSSEDNFKSL